MKKIVFGITSLTLGGAEKVLIDVVNNLVDKYQVTILTLYQDEELLKELNKKVNVVSINNISYKKANSIIKRKNGLLLRNAFYCKVLYNKYIKNKYDIEVAFLEGPITNLFSVSSNPNLYSFNHTDLTKHYSIKRCERLINVYEKYKKIIFVSKEGKDNFLKIKNAHKLEKKIYVIYNYFDPNRIISSSKIKTNLPFKKDKLSFLVVGRLVEAKGYERLINIHKELMKKYDYEIFAIGEGPLQEKLNSLVKENNIANTFHLLGKKDNPYPYIKECDYLLIPSIYEGYSMVAKEGITLNKYIIATKTGIVEALKDYDNCCICNNDEKSLSKALEKIIKERPKSILTESKKSQLDEYINIWEESK